MYTTTHLLLVTLITCSVSADLVPKDYARWAKTDILAWHQYFPSRMLEQERLVNQMATEMVTTIGDSLASSMHASVKYQAQELETAQIIMEGTSAQGCVKGISDYMSKAVDDGVANYQDCVADILQILQRLNISLAKTNDDYQTTFQRTLKGIDGCVRIYPNKDSLDRLKTCVASWTNKYFTSANSTMTNLALSRSMQAFISAVSCAVGAESGVIEKGWTFLDLLVKCAKLSENIDSESYERQLTSEFYKYETPLDVLHQIHISQTISKNLNSAIAQQMVRYYNLEKVALQKYVVQSRSENYYYGLMVQHMQQYIDTVESTSVDNPGEAECISFARASLNNIITTGSIQAEGCDAIIVNNTKFLLERANNNFLQINGILPYIGDFAIISCFSGGYIFAENTISDCYSLTLNTLNINIKELNVTIVDDVGVLQGYEKSFFSNASLPCSDYILSRANVEADRTLYYLKRCLYIKTGVKYDVTTTAPDTTTSNTTVATSTETVTPTQGAVYQAAAGRKQSSR